MINFTNHPYDMWDERQKEEACSFYTIQVWGRGTLRDLGCLSRSDESVFSKESGDIKGEY